jgi:hypothetical protein
MRLKTPFPAPSIVPFKNAHSLRWKFKQRFRGWTRVLNATSTFQMLEFARHFGRNHSRRIEDAESTIPAPAGACVELSRPIDIADPQIEISRRQALFQLCQETLRAVGVQPVFAELPGHVSPYGYPFFARPNQIAAARKQLASYGFRCLPWPELPGTIEATAPAHYRNIWLAGFLW